MTHLFVQKPNLCCCSMFLACCPFTKFPFPCSSQPSSAIIYGAHVSTTLVPILADILFGPQSGPHSLTLAAIYLPYLLVPFCMMTSFALDPDPFRTKSAKKKTAWLPNHGHVWAWFSNWDCCCQSFKNRLLQVACIGVCRVWYQLTDRQLST